MEKRKSNRVNTNSKREDLRNIIKGKNIRNMRAKKSIKLFYITVTMYNFPRFYSSKIFNAGMKFNVCTILKFRELNLKLMSWIHIG